MRILLLLTVFLLSSETAKAVSADEAEFYLARALAQAGAAKSGAASLAVSIKKTPALAALKPGAFKLLALEFNQEKGRFSATLGSGGKTARIEGGFSEVLRIPVLSSNFAPGREVSADDIVFEEIPVSKAKGGIFKSEYDMIGKVASRSIMKNRPVEKTALKSPVTVFKDASVTITYKSGPVFLQDEATALEAGREGEKVRVKNKKSGISVLARVVGPGQVAVGEEKQAIEISRREGYQAHEDKL